MHRGKVLTACTNLYFPKSPDELATTKQACRDELVVCLFFSSIYTSLYFYVLSTVCENQFSLYTCISTFFCCSTFPCHEAHQALTFSFHPLRFAVRALIVAHGCHPGSRLSSSIILLHVVLGRLGVSSTLAFTTML